MSAKLSLDAQEMAICCGKCRYWSADGYTTMNIGLCRRHAPQPSHGGFENEVLSHLTMLSWQVATDEQKGSSFRRWEEAIVRENSWWPATYDLDWCGEFSAKLI
jgi:hypothetical protein